MSFNNPLVEYVVSECVRQQTGPAQVGYMLNALDWASAESSHFIQSSLPTLNDAMYLASLVEPDVNFWRNNEDNFRKTPVTFQDGGYACHWTSVLRGAQLLFDILLNMDLVAIDQWCKSFLDIHPWADGNGRTVSILRNWILGTLDSPTTLPYYYGNEQ